jgi:uncharacterized C2H2 Zn-finger protein
MFDALLTSFQSQHPQTVTPCEDVPSLGTCSSPSRESFSTTTSQGSVIEPRRQLPLPNVPNGLGLTSSLQHTYYSYLEQAHDQLRIVQSTPQPPGKKRRIRRSSSPGSSRRSRPFSCSVCQQRFERKCNLTTHMRTHGTSDKDLVSCPEPGCTKVYTRQPDVNRHIKTAHEGRQWPCFQCGKVFKRKDILTRHAEACRPYSTGLKQGN